MAYGSVSVYHVLYSNEVSDMEEMLRSDGKVKPGKYLCFDDYYNSMSASYDSLLSCEACDAGFASERARRMAERGISGRSYFPNPDARKTETERLSSLGFSVSDAGDGWLEFNRRLTEDEALLSGNLPVGFNGKGNLCWPRKERHDDESPAIAVSRAYPNITFSLLALSGNQSYDVKIRNGELISEKDVVVFPDRRGRHSSRRRGFYTDELQAGMLDKGDDSRSL